METEKRFIIAMVLSLGFLFLYRYLFVPAPEPGTTQAPITTVTQPAAPMPIPESVAGAPSTAPPGTPQQTVTQAAPLELRVEDPRYTATLSNRGGVLTSWKFLERAAHQVELVRQELPSEAAAPLVLLTADSRINEQLKAAHYVVQKGDGSPLGEGISILKTPVALKFSYQGADFRAEKELRFGASDFLVEVRAEVSRSGQALPVWVQIGPGLGAADQALGADTTATQRTVILQNGKVDRREFGKIESVMEQSGGIQWAGLASQYFSTLALPAPGGALGGVRLRPFVWKKEETEIQLAAVDFAIAPGESRRVFFGPNTRKVLHGVDASLVEVIDYGWFGFVVEPLLLALNWIQAGLGNYGWSIIVLTFLITLALFPLRYKQMVSMKKMQKLQPQVKAIQEKYKKAKKSAEERQKMNVEMMALYKQHGVNPLGGCLPLVLQMPILFAFYSMLANAFELRGAPFMFWIQDLAAKDPYYITPLVMGVSMIISMKMTPSTTTDPMQSKMMMLMPVMMTFMFLNLSAGLNLYFLFSNIFSIAMQKASERLLPEMKAN